MFKETKKIGNLIIELLFPKIEFSGKEIVEKFFPNANYPNMFL